MARKMVMHVETLQVERQNRLITRIHAAVMALDSELAVVADREYRQRLVRTAYALRDIEESLLRNRMLTKGLPMSRTK